jgi:hypothetical protein
MINIITMETVACLWSNCHLKQNLIPSCPWLFRHTSCISDSRCKTKYTFRQNSLCNVCIYIQSEYIMQCMYIHTDRIHYTMYVYTYRQDPLYNVSIQSSRLTFWGTVRIMNSVWMYKTFGENKLNMQDIGPAPNNFLQDLLKLCRTGIYKILKFKRNRWWEQ